MDSREKTELTARKFGIARQCEEIREPYSFRILGLDFIGLPGVLSPELSPSTRMWRPPPVRSGQSFLEVGCGTGVFSVVAALAGASRVTAVDINSNAVANTLVNARLHSVADRLEAYESDVFDSVPPGARYDIILWNIPWSHTERTGLSLMEKATFDPGYVLLERYLSESIPHLAENGTLLVGYSSTFGDLAVLDSLVAQNGWTSRVLYQVGSAETFFAEMFALTRGLKEDG